MRGKRLAAPLAATPTVGGPIRPVANVRVAPEPPVLLSPRAVLESIFSFEALVVLYMFAGIYKSDPRFAWLPFDATALFFALSVLVGSFIIVRNPIRKKSLPVVFAMVCLVAWLWVSLTWSPSRIYGSGKAFQMTTLALWALTAGALIIAPSPERTRRLFTVMLLLALWGGVEAVLAYMQTGGATYRITTIEGEETGGHLILGRITAPGALVALAAWLHSRGRPTSWIYLGLFVALSFVLAIGGGRGALLSAALPALVPIALSVRLTPRKILVSRALISVVVLLLVAAGGLAIYAATTGLRLGTFDRLERLVEGNPRTELYEDWAKLWPQSPHLGHGTGSWPVLIGRPDRTSYPHNLFLELLVEAGIVGFILFLAVLAVALRPVSLEQLRRDPQALCATMLLLGALSNAMTSGDLPGNRAVFLMLGVLALFALRTASAAGGPVGHADPARVDLPMTRSSGLTAR
jgi:O-antigen ligase